MVMILHVSCRRRYVTWKEERNRDSVSPYMLLRFMLSPWYRRTPFPPEAVVDAVVMKWFTCILLFLVCSNGFRYVLHIVLAYYTLKRNVSEDSASLYYSSGRNWPQLGFVLVTPSFNLAFLLSLRVLAVPGLWQCHAASCCSLKRMLWYRTV